MNISELLEYNIKLFLINNAGLTYLNKSGSKLLEKMTNDPLLIKMHRRLHNKYGKIVSTYIITKSKNYYILEPELTKMILHDSPHLFSAGKIKDDFFKSVMPYNLGISKCTTKTDCPWKKRRIFNENVLGTQKFSKFFNCIQNIVNKNITKPLLNIDDFIGVSFKIIANTIYGLNTDANTDANANTLKQFIKLANDKKSGLLKTTFYKKYIDQLSDSYNTAPKCSLLYYANLYKNDTLKVINDQIPHWFAPFIFIISFFIPNLLCIILNFKEIYNKLMEEINDDHFNIYAKDTYLQYCVIEHLRLFNAINVNIQRTVEKDINYNDIQFKKGDQLFILFSSVLRNEKEFNKPDFFIPDRWENKSIKSQEIVFGIGPQQCPSKEITPIYYKTVIYHLLKNYNYQNVSTKLKNKNLHFINPYEIKFSVI